MDEKKYTSVLDNCFTYGTLAVSITIAKDVGVLDVLYENTEPLTSQQIADKRNLKERYVRELLGALATSGLVEVDSTSTKFHIEPQFKDILKARALFICFIPHIGQKAEALKKCFQKDGPAGIRYSEFPKLFQIMEDVLKNDLTFIIDNLLLESTPGLKQKLESGISVVEIGFGTGILTAALSERFPKSQFTGSDIVEMNIAKGKQLAEDRKLTNMEFCKLDVCTLPEVVEKQFDWLYCRDVIHDLPFPQKAISGFFKMLKPGGIFSTIEFAQDGKCAENVNNMHVSAFHTIGLHVCIPESYQDPNSAALGPCWLVDEARAMFHDAGFEIINQMRNINNPLEIVFVCQKPNVK